MLIEELGLIERVLGVVICLLFSVITTSKEQGGTLDHNHTKTKCHQTFTSDKLSLLNSWSAEGKAPIRAFSLLCCQIYVDSTGFCFLDAKQIEHVICTMITGK